MLRSMTGFGRGTGHAGATQATVEVRAVNGRYAEVSVRGPRVLNAFDPAVQALCKEELERGSVTVSITLQRPSAEAGLAVDREAARVYGRLLLDLRDAAGLKADEAPVTLDHLLRYDVLTSEEPDVEAEQTEAWAAVEPALQEALGRLDTMRVQEGRALCEDLVARLDAIEGHLDAVAARAPARVAEAQARLRERLAELLADERLNPDRLETEIALLADKLDVNEEVVRLRSHLAQFRDALGADEAVGRRLNFLAQELNREINTIASKANDADLAARAVRMKEELEKVREQVQNVV
ncbi:MAG: YicC/YloC family endoribonuclease [Rubricoccaceae bacterium]|nr:YicC/YloC family endoribonuclease [Rubricoccaceae bacterium]